ncbi:NUDIX hydrolase [Lentzea flaviverrucosa]|uniref:ADP-ribose pyrophosphatase YjhB, NUDIX family n=1 Tax=Lentzea flaviverrucosa TaxID=200379 RepID=A0A1H9JH57_9PSEU|nr:NUDIX domain-containing protein [Lentzea flaviverrucosa]RDI26512.1 ADP-ribose pyrophosphatase YjhB (NUDIX family) [Lentzea flaviverrucosa]SEQ86321.1 ADP-ribose pyrophosphatase YjhB, NUDIX family [Lentzea flaviverrucosa]
MTFRLAAYAVSIENDHVLLVRDDDHWSLPGGGVEPLEDPFDAVVREVAEETGCEAVVERLLGVDSRVISPADRYDPSRGSHQNVGVFYLVRITGEPRPEPNGATADPQWTPISAVAGLRRSSLLDVGLALALTRPPTGHVGPVEVGGLVQH